jgi:D-alanine--poly(phosphoribitol) ligase subunit 1
MYYYNLGQNFSDVAQAKSQLPALHYPGQSYTYANLIGWVEALSELLLDKGCRQGDVVAIGHNKEPLSYALMLSCLRLGIAYVNIDTASPLERNARILKVCSPRLLFYDSIESSQSMSELAKEQKCEVLMLEEGQLPEPTDQALAEQKNMMAKVDGACIAYIMFTSGSTGTPKGVAVTHQNVLHFISWGQDRFNIGDQDNLANLSPMYFDNSVFDFYVGLFSGASLSPVPRELLTSPYDLVAYVGDRCSTIWFSVPSLLIYLQAMKAITPEALPKLRTFVFGGEGYPKTELKKLYESFSSQAELVNVYGPTECTCICSAYTLSEMDFEQLGGLPTLGHLNPNFDYKILGDQGEESNTGELCLIGPNVAAGYFNDVERTTSSFQTLYERNRFMKRMYRTGDLVQEVKGKLYFLGRKDNQIKHMGYRIELEEIEAAVHTLPGIVQAAVVYKRVSTAYGKILCYVKADSQFDANEVMGQLSRKLPEYMIPSKITVMDHLPKNPNGKVDRKLLSTL